MDRWGQRFRRFMSLGMDNGDAAFRADQAEDREIERPYIGHGLCGYHGKRNSWGYREALLSDIKMLRARFEKARCDDPAVSCCVRCNVMHLIKFADEMLSVTNEKGELISRPEPNKAMTPAGRKALSHE